MTQPDNPSLGISLRILSGVLFTGMVVCVKALSDAVPLGQIVFFRSFFALIPLVTFLMARHEFPGAIAFYFVVVSMAGGILTLLWGWTFPDAQTLMLLVLAGLFGGCAHIAMTLSFSYAEASRLAPFEYVALLWPVLADLLIFDLPLGTSFLFALPLVLLGAGVAAFEGKAGLKLP
ncbi:hypothetical protein [Litoreibacter roseus]|uniref:EamA-like transporter family protein n=1 Tax=Litoreibacter roseus TaxID=2601869 RepID=A0A6N6JJQ2_9RHOB|nr:hypothetical protein [Litoreibacter roseus]GFE66167.1 hypothetical protein KIN_32410 [Litoreibacter roseus]